MQEQGEIMASWFSSNRNSLKKSQYYVWFLGSKESDGLRGRNYVVPIMRDLIKDSVSRLPNKITVQISEKGLKLVQSVPTVSKSGKVKTEVMKFYIPSHSITYGIIGPPPYNDVVATVLLVFNPETKCPIHVHCYRCDSPETAIIMHSNLQILINRPDSQIRISHLERRLVDSGLLLPPKTGGRQFPNLHRDGYHRPVVDNDRSPIPNYPTSFEDNYNRYSSENYAGESGEETDYVGMSSDESEEQDENSDSHRLAKLHQAVFLELKEKLRSEPPILLPPRDYTNTFRNPKQKCEQRKPAIPRKKIFSPPRHSPSRETNFFWKKREGNLDFSRKLSTSVTALDEGALTSSTSGLGSELSSSGGRFRYSMANISFPTAQQTTYYGPQFSNDRELPETGLSMRTRNVYSPTPYAEDERSKFPVRNASNLDRERRFNRFFSSENIHAVSDYPSGAVDRSEKQNLRMFGDTFKSGKRGDSVYPQSKGSNNRYFHIKENSWKNGGLKPDYHRSVDNLHFPSASPDSGNKWRSVVDPFGRRYEQSMKVDGFWKERAKQASWLTQPQRNRF